MESLKKPWKLAGLLALGALFSLGPVEQSRAFTLIEMLLVPAVQLVAFQSGAVNVTNTSGNDITATITIVNGTGILLKQKTETIVPGATFTVTVKPGGLPFRFSATVALDTAQAAVADAVTFDINTGQVMAVVPMVELSGN
jgi:archaellum component FlaF (FlaF/FlaG flagellin family)